MTKLRQRRAVLSGLTVAAVLAAAGAGWLLSPSNAYTDASGVVHNQQPAWEVLAGVALALLAVGFLVLTWRMAGPETARSLVLGVAAPLAGVTFLLAVGLRGSTREVFGADIGAGLYLLFAVPLMLGLLAVPVVVAVATVRRRRRA
jgi:cytochrome bd-type quinol oxidase subunit 2